MNKTIIAIMALLGIITIAQGQDRYYRRGNSYNGHIQNGTTRTVTYTYQNGRWINMTPSPREATTLPSQVIDPRTYGDTNAQIRYTNTEALVQRGFQIIRESGHYDPNIHTDRYVRIPRTGSQIYGNRW